ncbi:hypothetical protein U9M48_043618, partial [Paspalum notatum var. saurae]
MATTYAVCNAGMPHLRYKGWDVLDRTFDCSMECRHRVRKVSFGFHSLLSLLRKDLRDSSFQSFLGGSSCVSNPLAAASDLAKPSLSEKDQKEKAQRSKFVHGLVLSTKFDDDN